MKISANISKLTRIEKIYYMMMVARGAVPFVQGRPGEAKTAIVRSIASKLGYQFIDIRLSQIDEAVVTGLPLGDENGKSFSFRTPDWALRANEHPTIICFEEYNRAKLEQRNAAMQIMCEREVGMNHKFNDDVLMIATGNLGEEDGTDVEEIESAQRGRLATIRHTLTIEDWEEGYAKENVHPLILSFIKTNPQYFYKYEGDEAPAYASPRSWDYLSKFITRNNLGDGELTDYMVTIGKSYVGSTIQPFIRYIEQLRQISVKDILTRYDEIREFAIKFTRPQISEYLINLQEMTIEKLKAAEVDNLIKFLGDIKDDDELASFFVKIVAQLDYAACKKDPNKMKNTRKIMNTFPDIKERIKGHHKDTKYVGK